MGEAKRRKDAAEKARAAAYAEGRMTPSPRICPACQSSKTVDIPYRGGSLRFRGCYNCKAAWEPFPLEGYIEDPVCAEPCDNCAFRPGSPEQEDKAEWKALIDTLRPDGDGWFQGRFYCHKEVPIDLSKGPGNFLYPQKPGPDGALVWDTSKMRTCSGFLRMFWALQAKQEAENPDG